MHTQDARGEEEGAVGGAAEAMAEPDVVGIPVVDICTVAHDHPYLMPYETLVEKIKVRKKTF